MARKPLSKAKPKTARKIDEQVISAALTLAAARGWRNVTLRDIAKEAGLSLTQVHSAYRSKNAIHSGFLDGVDAQVLAGGGEDEGPARDRLFDVLMRRFDALTPHKAGLAAIARDVLADPSACLCLYPEIIRSMTWMLEAANVSSAGLGGRIKAHGLALIYLNAFRVWLGDDTDDMSSTMAALDFGLRRAERLMNLCYCRPKPAGQGEEAAA